MPEHPRIRVLLIDDDPAAYALTRAIMDQIPWAEFDLDLAATDTEGRRALARGEHDVYLVDYQLGEASGIDLVREARAAGNRAPMILITGRGRHQVDVEAMEAGVSDYLEKGKVDPDHLERAIRYSIERSRAEAALRESEARHRSLFDHLPIGLYRTAVDGQLLDANPALVQLLGHPDRDALEFDYARNFFVSPAHRQAFLGKLDQFGVVRGFESDLKRSDGHTIRVRTAARSHRDGEGGTVYVEGAVEDQSEEQEARDVHGLAAQFHWVFSESGLAIVTMNLLGAVLDANPAFLRSFGYGMEELRGTPFSRLAQAEDRGDLEDELARIATGAADLSEAQRRFAAADGGVLWARTRTGLVRSFKGHPDHLIILLEEVAEA